MHEYDLIAEWYASQRLDSTGLPETESLAHSLAPASKVLDVGCGNGLPITRALLSAGHQVVGLDSSCEMLARVIGSPLPQPTSRTLDAGSRE
jgi:ubiquinone/menaquinone biosynthesis C-methylase UbiE